MQGVKKGPFKLEAHPEVVKTLNEWSLSKSITEQSIIGVILAECHDLEKFEGPNRGYERVHALIAGVPVYLWKKEEYEMFYRFDEMEPAVILLHVCVVNNQYARQNALKTVEARIDWRE
ncbi:MAG: hypothetical protein HY848_06830 [Betaproteobacteria bacterium]|nr:hypothetical protein [Betaproteobacteria bacterium]